MASFGAIFHIFLLWCSLFSSATTFLYVHIISLFYSSYFLYSASASGECERIPYPQAKTKITYYDSAHKIPKEHLYTHVAKPILQNFTISLEINENASGDDKKLLFSKERYFVKVRGNWSEYPLKKLEDVCLAFVHVAEDNYSYPINDNENEKKNEANLRNNEPNSYCNNIFSSDEAFVTCYKENNFSVENIFLYFEISKVYLKGLTYFYNIPVTINSENDIIYLSNYSKDDKKQKKTNLNLHVCYQSSMEKEVYLGKVVFNAYPLNVENSLLDDDFIYTYSFLTNKWNYYIFINGKYLTHYNRLVFFKAPTESNVLIKCELFWDYSILGAAPSFKNKKKEKENFLDQSHKYSFSDNIPNDYFIPFLKNDELKTEYKYLLCLYADENDFEGIAIKNVHFSYNTTYSIVLFLFITFMIIFLPLIFSLTIFFILIKLKFLHRGLNKLQLMNRKDEIEERLKIQLNLDEHEISS